MQDSLWIYIYIVLGPALLLMAVLGISLVAQLGERFYSAALGLLLLGYLVMGKGIAYLGIAPLYVSEIVLLLGCGTVVMVALVRQKFHIGGVLHWGALCLLLFMLWGAARTLPYLPVYRLEALRDGVIWGYGTIAFLVALLFTPARLEYFFAVYGRLLPFILLWLVLAEVLSRLRLIPMMPGAPVEIIYIKAGDAGVHLAGAGAFLLMRLDRIYGKPYAKWQIWGMWICWGLAWLFYGTTGRSGMISALLGVAVAFLLRPNRSGWLRPAILVFVLLVGLFFADIAGISQVNVEARRVVSFEQVVNNFASLLGGEARSDLEGTMQWRLRWWKMIADYTLEGGYFWQGKGYGVNLAIADGFPSPPGSPPNRHPHNITMNVLGRSGVPGLALWLLFLAVFGWRLFKATTRHGAAGGTAIWLLAYWLAFLFNAQTDVFIEGPMGGIWFWAIVGMSWVFIYRTPKWHAREAATPVASYAIPQSAPSPTA